ncbi:methyltransferase domain-containing protein [Halovulum dunhuangense]|uniref:Methyltransferase domain-containing protein n=1 Tax=Halovulum dunhuangense TaxID=1505036 RepID=A0A849L5Y2_9RHOB|nr:methyltransferase domain-containing protein [Halovulum dunhuangense]
MSGDPQTLAFYDDRAADYAEFADARAETLHPQLQAFLARMPLGARILDLGCGTGWAAAAMQAQGHRADAWDASHGMAEEAKARHGIEVRVAPFHTLSARNRYDGIWCHFALQHAPRETRAPIFERLGNALRPGGLLYLGVQKGPRDWRDDMGRLYCPFREDEMTDLLTAAGFSDLEYEAGTGRNFDGTPTLNLYVRARRNG